MDLTQAKELEAYSDKFLTEGYYGSNWSYETMILKDGDSYRLFYADGECCDPKPNKVGGFFLDSKEAIEAMNYFFGGSHNDFSRLLMLEGFEDPDNDDEAIEFWEDSRDPISEQFAPYTYLSVRKFPELQPFYDERN